MKLPLRLGRSFAFAKRPKEQRKLYPIAGFGIVGLMVAGFSHLPNSNSQQVAQKIVPLVLPIISSDERFRQAEAPPRLSTTAGVNVQDKPPARLNSAQSALKEATVAVALSQAQLAQARINLIEFQAKHNKVKILSARGQVNRQQAATAKAAYKLTQLQHSAAAIGLQASQAQLIAARAEVRRMGCQANTATRI